MAAFVAKQMVGNKLSAVKGEFSFYISFVFDYENPRGSWSNLKMLWENLKSSYIHLWLLKALKSAWEVESQCDMNGSSSFTAI